MHESATSDQLQFYLSLFQWFNQEQDEYGQVTIDLANGESITCTARAYYALSGSAGSGKTYAAVQAIKALVVDQLVSRVAVCAPTHKAVRVIIDKLQESEFSVSRSLYDISSPGVYAGTIHSFVSAQPETTEDPEDESEVYEISALSLSSVPLFQCDFIVVDEASMIGAQLFTYLVNVVEQQLANGIETRVLFIGDAFQLYPVEKNPQISPVFSLPYQFALNKVVRYDGSILKQAVRFRDEIINGLLLAPPVFDPRPTEDMKYVRDSNGYRNSRWFQVLLERAHETLDNRLHQDYCRALTFTRRGMAELNHEIRLVLHGDRAKTEFLEGEWLFSHGLCSSFVSPERRLEKIMSYVQSGYPMVLEALRLANSRDYNLIGAKYAEVAIPNPLPGVLDLPDDLIQPCTLGYIRLFSPKLGHYVNVDVAILTPSQLKYFSDLRARIDRICDPFLAEADRIKAESIVKSVYANEKYRQAKIIRLYLNSLNHAFNVAETTYNKRYETKPDLSVAEREVIDRGQRKTKQVMSKLQPGWTITINKAQGSTIDHVFLNFADTFCIGGNQSQASRLNTQYRIVYTGVTRASKTLTVYSKY